MRCVAIPNPLTRHLPLGDADLVLASLADHRLAEILARLGDFPESGRQGVTDGGLRCCTRAQARAIAGAARDRGFTRVTAYIDRSRAGSQCVRNTDPGH